MVTSLLEIARGYVAAGLSVIPIKPDGSKSPALASWKEHQSERATDAKLAQWFKPNSPWGIAIICGKVSGNLEVIDFDTLPSYERWLDKLQEESPALLVGLTVVATPEGRHVYVRRPWPVQHNRKLARDPQGEIMIETRGEGGYVLAPGCPLACHPSRKPYYHLSGPPLTNIGVCDYEF